MDSAVAVPALDQPTRVLRGSLAISALRCTLSYLVLPLLLPIVGISVGLDSPVGLILGPVAIAANVYSIQRFWSADHRMKIPVGLLNLAIIVLLTVLLIGDAQTLFA